MPVDLAPSPPPRVECVTCGPARALVRRKPCPAPRSHPQSWGLGSRCRTGFGPDERFTTLSVADFSVRHLKGPLEVPLRPPVEMLLETYYGRGEKAAARPGPTMRNGNPSTGRYIGCKDLDTETRPGFWVNHGY